MNTSPTDSPCGCAVADSLYFEEVAHQFDQSDRRKTHFSAAMKELEGHRAEAEKRDCMAWQLGFLFRMVNAYSYDEMLPGMSDVLTRIDALFARCPELTANLELEYMHQYYLGRFYSNVGDFQGALHTYQRSKAIIKKLIDNGNPGLVTNYANNLSNMGTALRKLGREEEAIDYFREEIKWQKPKRRQLLTYNKIASTYCDLGQSSLAKLYSDTALAIAQTIPDSEWKKHQNTYITVQQVRIRTLNLLQKNSPSAQWEREAHAAFRLGSRYFDKEGKHVMAHTLYSPYADFLRTLGKTEEAKHYARLALGFCNEKYKNSYRNQLAELLLEQDSLDGAAAFLREIEENLDTTQPFRTENALFLKNTCQHLAQSKQKNAPSQLLSTLEQSFSSILQKGTFGHQVEDLDRNAAGMHALAEKGIEAAFRLFETEQDSQYLNRAFALAEANRAYDLKMEQLRMGVLENNIPEDLKRKEIAYRFAFGQAVKAKDGEQQLLCQERYDRFFSDTLNKLPGHVQQAQKIAQQPTIAARQRLLPKSQAVLSYYVGENAVYAFLLFPSGRPIVKCLSVTPQSLEEKIEDFRSLMTESPWQKDNLSGDWLEQSYALYSDLIDPLAAQLPERLTVVPDGPLCLLPFSALLQSPPKRYGREKVPFADLDYMLNHHIVDYSYSSAFQVHKTDWATHRKARFVGFAPSYADSKTIAANLGEKAVPMQTYLPEIPGGGALLDQIGSKFGAGNAILLKAEQATKSKFEALNGEIDYLHLHTHGVLDGNEKTFLAFHQNSAIEPDSNLHLRDLYQMQLNVHTVTLPACYSGYGKGAAGQGLVSVSRAFIRAGAKNVFPVLWQGNAGSMADLTARFYDNIHAGMDGAKAMNYAKRAYLKENQNKMRAHPHYWASYIAIGSPNAAEEGSDFILWAVLFGVALLVFFWYEREV